MVFTIDASSTLKWIFEDEIYSDQALKLQKDYLTGKVQLITPNIWIFEVANAIRSAFLRKRVDNKIATKKLKQLLRSAPGIVNIEDEIDVCLKNSFEYDISTYDSAYLTLALANKVPLISSDIKLVKKIDDSEIILNLKDY